MRADLLAGRREPRGLSTEGAAVASTESLMKRLVSSLFVVPLAVACGDGVQTPQGTPAAPLFSVRAEARGTLTAEAPIRAALAWTVTSPELIECLDGVEVEGVLSFSDETYLEDEQIAGALQRCLTFSERAHVETASVPIEPEFPLALEIPVLALPDTALLSGDRAARLGIADVIVYEDQDEDGVFDETPRGAGAFADIVKGTSRALDESDTSESFIAYREGELSSVWKIFRAIYGCPDPAPGFSTVTLSIDDDGLPGCVIDDRAVDVDLRDDIAVLGCAPNGDSGEPIRADRADGIPVGAEARCENAGDGWFDVVYTTNPESVCPSTTTLALVGCDTSSEAACRATFYDLAANPPSWWPCSFGNGTQRYIYQENAATALTSSPDALFEFSYFEGLEVFPLELRVEMDLPDGSVADDFVIVVTDHDDNGVWNAGDRVSVSEGRERFDVDAPAGNYPLRLLAGDTLITGGAFAMPVAFPRPPALTFVTADAAGALTVGVDDLCTLTWSAGESAPFALADVAVRGYLGGEWPFGGTGGEGVLVLVDDVDDDGLFGLGDTVLVRDHPEGFNDVSAELLQSFGAMAFLEVSVPVGFNLTGHVGGATVELQ